VDGNDRLLGIVTLSDLEHAILQSASGNPTESGAEAPPERAGDIMATDLAIAYPDESLEEALRTMAQRNVGRLPVVEPGDPTRLVGLLRRQDVIEAFRQARESNDAANAPLRIGAWGGTQFFEIALAPDAPAANCLVRDLAVSLPPETLIAAVRRAQTHQVVLPRGDTVLRPGDVVAVLTRPRYRLAARRLFESPNQATPVVSAADSG
ncbi:MAG TPA: CBS domain-containing protein, partial [Chloroflexota bacterium]|nr:CBS domain-containing protein [Chloroflexota bacterium]